MKTLNNTIETNVFKTLTQNELFELLVNETKSNVVSIEYITDDNRSKTIKGQKQVQKHVRINNLYLNHDYTKKVQNISGDTTFQSFEMKGKTRISSTIIQSDKTKTYLLDGKILNSESVELINYFHNGNVITESEAIGEELWTNSYFETKEKTTSGRGLINEENDFKMITLGLDKIIKIKFNKITYFIEN